MPNGLGTIVGTPYSGAFCMSPMFEEDEDLHTWSYNDAQSNGVVREIACDKLSNGSKATETRRSASWA